MRAGGTVTVRLPGDWATIDPQNPSTNPGNQGLQIIWALYDTLVDVGRDGKLTPYLAKSWELTPTSIKFTLRGDATCADGAKINATVVKNSWERGLKAAGTVARLGKGPYSLSADDAAGTFTFTTQTPYSDAIYNFSGGSGAAGSIVCPSGLANPAGVETAPQGSGPYTLVSAVHGDQVVLKLRREWKWGPSGLTANSPGLPENLIFKVVTNETTAANLLLTGGLDLGKVAGQDIDRLTADTALTNKAAASAQSNPLVFNHTPGHPTADPKVRETLIKAIDPKKWNQIVHQGKGVVSPGFLAPRADCYDASLAKYLWENPSPEKAKAVLTSAGWTLVNGKFQKDGRPLTVDFVATTANVGSGPDYLVSSWDSAGITVKSEILDFNAYLQRLLRSDFDVLPEQVSGDTPNPSSGIVNFLGPVPPAGNNFPRTVDPEAENELNLAHASVGAERCQHWSNAQRLLLQNFNALPLSAPATRWFSRHLDFVPGVSIINPRYIKRIK